MSTVKGTSVRIELRRGTSAYSAMACSQTTDGENETTDRSKRFCRLFCAISLCKYHDRKPDSQMLPVDFRIWDRRISLSCQFFSFTYSLLCFSYISAYSPPCLTRSSWLPYSVILPPEKTAIRSATFEQARRCDMKTVVLSFAIRKKFR